MKTALLFRGYPRHSKETFEAIYHNIIAIYNPDVYAHFWWDDSYIGESYLLHRLAKIKYNWLEEFIKLYQPKNILWEPQKKFDISRIQGGPMWNHVHWTQEEKEFYIPEVLSRIYSQAYSHQKAYELMLASNTNYDWIISIRTDISINGPLSIDFLDKNKLNCPYSNWEKENKSDFLVAGQLKYIERFCNMYNDLEELDENLTGCAYFHHHFHKYKIPSHIFHTPAIEVFRFEECDHNTLYKNSNDLPI